MHEGGAENVHVKSFWRSMTGNPSQIWKSRISWRITTTVFATILLVQTCVLVVSMNSYETDKLNALRDNARAAMAPALLNVREQLLSPLSAESAEKLIVETSIDGLAIYALDYTLIQIYGDPTIIKPSSDPSAPSSYRTVDSKSYEVIFEPDEISRPYHIVARLDSSNIDGLVASHVHQSLIIFLLMSGFVTSVLMLALGTWLLEPMILLRNNLLNAAKNPDKPDLQRMKKDTRDEIGIAIRIANDLIRQNANNLKRLRAQAEDKIHKLAYFDALTGLPNRTYFLEKLDDNIKHKVIEEDRRLAV